MQSEKVKTHSDSDSCLGYLPSPYPRSLQESKVFSQVLRKETFPGEWTSSTVLVTLLSLLPDREKCSQLSWVSETNAGMVCLLSQGFASFLTFSLSIILIWNAESASVGGFHSAFNWLASADEEVTWVCAASWSIITLFTRTFVSSQNGKQL